MPTFLSNVVDDILRKDAPLSDYTFILPSKRAGNFLKKEIKNKVNKPLLLPTILSIEDFIYELSSISLLDTTSLLFEFYSVYLNNTAKDKHEDFDAFSKWATIALQDFNEIDRHLVDTHYIFDYLKSIDRLESWNIEKGSETRLIKDYLSFFERLDLYYHKLYQQLLSNNLGYQGIQYREAFENIQNYIENNLDIKLVFIGFNALNRSEESIIKELLENQLATIYWDADSNYFTDHPASTFLNRYQNNWTYYQNHTFNWIEDNFDKKKNIKIIGAPKNTSQAKYVGTLLSQISSKENNYENTALVLADESLLPITLNSLPKEVNQVNITMGYELNNMTISSLIETLLKLHIDSKSSGEIFYYKGITQLFSLPDFRKIVDSKDITNEILKNNFIYLSSSHIRKLADKFTIDLHLISFLFESWQNNADIALRNCLRLIDLIKDETTDKLEKEFLFKNMTVLHQLQQLNDKTGYIKNIKTLHLLYKQLIKTEKLSFRGEPLSGLQIMGMLETRVLDFDNVILTSVNEGILPAGKTDTSFIPFDVKKDPRINLPTYQERDAIFSYHFYRLIQRAKNIFLLYNTENDHYGSGEQSRFITELEIKKSNEIDKFVVSPKVSAHNIELKNVIKSKSVIDRLHELATKGFSPTSLAHYINNPIGFYQEKILGIKELEEAEETVASNTLGTIIHKTLESFYTPFKDVFLKKEDILTMKKKIKNEVLKWFTEVYKNGDITSGKNLLIYNVAQQFISNFLDQELKLVGQGDRLKILDLEYDLESKLTIDELGLTVKLTGQADRIDELDGTIRIIDYKTGKVAQNDVTVKNWDLISKDYKYSKGFQVLFYALLYGKEHGLDFDSQSVESGIISFKNLNSGFLKINRGTISNQDISNFTLELKRLISEIFNPNIPFIENENKYF